MTTTYAPVRFVADSHVIRAMRYEKGWSASQLATNAGISQGSVSRIECGHSHGSPRALRAIADALGVAVADITKRVPDTG